MVRNDLILRGPARVRSSCNKEIPSLRLADRLLAGFALHSSPTFGLPLVINQ